MVATTRSSTFRDRLCKNICGDCRLRYICASYYSRSTAKSGIVRQFNQRKSLVFIRRNERRSTVKRQLTIMPLSVRPGIGKHSFSSVGTRPSINGLLFRLHHLSISCVPPRDGKIFPWRILMIYYENTNV